MFLKLGFFVLFICVLSQHNFVDANEHTLPGNFFRRIGDWQHARGDAWDRKAHIWHIFDKSDEPQETPIGNLKREFGDKTYKFADKVDGLAEQGKKIFGQVVGSFITKIQNKGKQPAQSSPKALTNSQPAPAAPTEGPTTSVSTNSNANARPAPTAPTSFTASAQPPTIESMFNPENIPLPSGFNPAPPPRRNPSPSTSDPITPTGGPYFLTNYNPGSPPTGGPYFPTNYNPGSPPTGGPYFPTNYNPGSPPTGGPYFPTNYNPGSPPTGGPYFPTNYNPGSPPTGGVTGGVSGGVTGGVSGGVYFPTSLRPTVPRDLPTTRSTKSSAGKLVFIDNQGKSTELSPEQIVDIGKYFDQLLKGSN